MKQQKIVGYCRFSTIEQKKGYGIDIQKRDIEQFAETRHWQVHEFYIDEALSGAEEKRTDLDRLLRDCRTGKIKAVIVGSLCRFARSVRFAENFFYELEQQREVRVCFADMPHYDGTDPSAVMARQFREIIAEQERVALIDRLNRDHPQMSLLSFTGQ